MIAEPQGQQDARGDEKKTMSVKFDDGTDLGRFCWIFLRNALKDAEWRTRACAAWGIGVAAERMPHEHLEPAVEAVGDAITDTDGFVRFWIVDAMGKLGSEASIPLVQASLEDKDDYVRINAAKVLSQLGQPDGSKRLIDALSLTPSGISRSPEDRTRNRRAGKLKMFAIECLGEIGSLSAIPHISERLKSSHWPIRASSAWALGMIGDRGALPAVTPLMHDRVKMVRISASEATARLGEEKGTAPLRSALMDPDKSVKYKAAESLAKLGYKTGIELLADALDDSDTAIQNMAVTALGKVGDISVLEPLIEKLKSDNWQLRADAAVAIGRIGEKEALKALKKKVEDPVRNVRVCAAVAILMILGR
jgi:HEAT repeat protein